MKAIESQLLLRELVVPMQPSRPEP